MIEEKNTDGPLFITTKGHLKDLFYLTGLFFIFTSFLLKSTLIPEISSNFLFSGKFLIPLGLLFGFASFIISEKFTLTSMLLITIIMPITLLTVYLTWAQSDLFIFTFMFICGYSVNRDYILSSILYIVTFEILLVIVLTKINIIPDLVYMRSIGVYRHSLGFIYPTDFAAHVSYLCFLYGWKKANRFNIIDLILWLIIAYYLLLVTDARLDVGCIVLAVSFFFFFAHRSRWQKHRYIWLVNLFSSIAFPAMLLLSFWLIKLYDSSANIAIVADNILSGRLNLGSEALALYPISISGNEVFENGLGSFAGYNANRALYGYFMIDSSYVRVVIIYGLISLALVGLIIAISVKRIIKERNVFSGVVLIMVALHCFVAQFMLNPSYDLILMLALTCPREYNVPRLHS